MIKKKKNKKNKQPLSVKNSLTLKVSVCIHIHVPAILCFTFFDFFFFFLRRALTEFQWFPCTIHRTYKPLFLTKLSLKMGFTVLFTHLKIILLQCFYFSVLNIISGIQTNPKGLFKSSIYSY